MLRAGKEIMDRPQARPCRTTGCWRAQAVEHYEMAALRRLQL
jgi:ferritin-like metal-binding protein YciE